MGGDPVIEVAGLVAHYGAREVLHGVSLEVRAGEIMVIMGGSGSGKSTLLRHMIGLERRSAGAVRLLGVDFAAAGAVEAAALRRKLGVAFQGGALLSSLSVLDNVMLPLCELTRLDRKTMEIMARMKLEVVGLGAADRLMPSQLSGGMVKRAALARALVMDPAVLFCDEPSAGLDPAVAAALDDLILELRASFGMTVVVVTHERDSAFKIADRIAVLDQGEILTVDTVAALQADGNPRIRALLDRRNETEALAGDAYLRRLTGEAAGLKL